MNPETILKYQPKMNLGPIKDVLGDDIPDITPTPLGRHRLVSALKNKFGENYRNVAKSRVALDHFDREHDYFQNLRRIQGGY